MNVQITSFPAPQPRSGASLNLTSPGDWHLQFQDLPSVQWLQSLKRSNHSMDSFKLPRPSILFFWVLDSVDMRLVMDYLSARVQSQLQTKPREGHIFVIKNKRGTRIKVLKWDATGEWLA